MINERMALPIGAVVRGNNTVRYVVEAILGWGGFSAVYRVRRQDNKQVYALKEVIHPGTEERRNLATEALLLKRLHHSSLPQVYQVFENIKLNRIYLLMDYIEGANLEILRCQQPENRFPLEFVLPILLPVIQAIAYLHAQQPPIVHRDIKPSNIIVPRKAGDGILVDFGLAKEYIEEKTTNVLRYGTPGYAAPEQYAQGTNPRTDIYGLGATVYTLLTGVRPVDALVRILEGHRRDPLQRADYVAPVVPLAVAQVLERSMCLRNDMRFASVEEFWQTLCLAAEYPEYTLDEVRAQPAARPAEEIQEVFQAVSLNVAEISTIDLPAQKSEQKHDEKRSPQTFFSLWITVPLLLVLLSILTGLLFFLLPGYPPKTGSRPPVRRAPASAVHANTCGAPTVGIVSGSAYPLLQPCYAGTINDIGVASEKTGMYLTSVQQNQGTFSGHFNGLNVTGNIQGTIQQNGDLRFVVLLTGRTDLLIFTGNSKYGGDMRGSFEVHDKTGRPTLDEYGSWYLAPMH